MNNINNLLEKEKTTKENRVWVRISAACNNLCIFCLDSDAQNWKLISEEKIKKEILQWFKKWMKNRIIISWGEASINPKFSEYIRYSKEIWYDRVQTVTNGNMFASESFCRKVFAAWLQEVTFSFHWHNPLLHDYLVATPGAFIKSLKWLIFIKKNFPEVILNIDIVVNKINVGFLPDIVKFFIKFGIYEYDILQIIPFGRGFSENKNKLFYDIGKNLKSLQETWKLSKTPGMYMWTNRFPAEAFEWWYEDLIQDPRKIKSEVMWESKEMFQPFILSKWIHKPECFWERCNYCFLQQYCHDYLSSLSLKKVDIDNSKVILWEEFPSDVYEKYGKTIQDFKNILLTFQKPLINIPKCLGWTGIYQTYNDMKDVNSLEDYTSKYIKNLYRKKSLKCAQCVHNKDCKWIHINFIRSYWFDILTPVIN